MKLPRRPADQRLNAAAFVATALIGGGNPVGVAVSVDELDPLWAAATRFVAAGTIFAFLMVLFRIPIPRGKALVGGLIYGVFGFFGAFACLFWGFRETPPGTGQIIIALVPLLTLILAVAHGLERFSLRALIGVLVAFAGLAFLVADRVNTNVPLLSLLAVVAGAVFLAESAVVIKLTPRAHPVASNAVAMLCGGVLLLAISAFIGDAWQAPKQSDTWVAMIFLVLGGSVAVFGLYVFLLGRWRASAVSYVLLLQPVAAIMYPPSSPTSRSRQHCSSVARSSCSVSTSEHSAMRTEVTPSIPSRPVRSISAPLTRFAREGIGLSIPADSVRRSYVGG